MSLTYATALKVTRMAAVRDAIDAQTVAGKLVIYDSSNAVLCTFTLAKPCGTVSASGAVTLVISAPLLAAVTAAGVADHATIKDGAGNDIVTGLTVGTALPAHIVIPSSVLTINEPIQLTSAVIQHG